MSAPFVQNIPLDQIEISGRIRPVDHKAAAKLALSMQETDGGTVIRRQINPIIVRPKKGGGYVLVVGAHRLAAASKLGWEDIAAIVGEMSNDDAKLLEIDENLYRADLTQADLTFFMKSRLELFAFNGGKLRRGKPLGKSANLADLTKPEENRYYAEIELKFGIKRRTAERLVSRARNIPEYMWVKIRKNPAAYNGSLLDKISHLEGKSPGVLLEIIEEKQCTIREAVKFANAPTKEALKNTLLERMKRDWAKAPSDIRAAFKRFIQGQNP